jgi:hypothetical protein
MSNLTNASRDAGPPQCLLPKLQDDCCDASRGFCRTSSRMQDLPLEGKPLWHQSAPVNHRLVVVVVVVDSAFAAVRPHRVHGKYITAQQMPVRKSR